MSKFRVIGASGRLGKVVCETMLSDGHVEAGHDDGINYLVFAHRYRGNPLFDYEIKVNVGVTVDNIESARWADGDRAVVIVSSICAENPVAEQSIGYNVSKTAQLQVARYYAKRLNNVRCNTVSPAGFTGNNPVVGIQQVADVIAFLCSTKASGINGQDIKVTG